MTKMATPQLKSPSPGGQEIGEIKGELCFLIFAIYSVFLHSINQFVERSKHFYNMTYMAKPYYKRILPLVLITLTILAEHCFLIVTIYSLCLLDAQKQNTRFLKKNINFTVLPEINLKLGGHEIYKLSCLSPIDKT